MCLAKRCIYEPCTAFESHSVPPPVPAGVPTLAQPSAKDKNTLQMTSRMICERSLRMSRTPPYDQYVLENVEKHCLKDQDCIYFEIDTIDLWLRVNFTFGIGNQEVVKGSAQFKVPKNATLEPQ